MEGCLKQADGTPVEAWGHNVMNLQVGKMSQPLDITVAEISSEGILSMDFLLASGGTLNFDQLKLKVNG